MVRIPPDQSLTSRSAVNPRAIPVMGCTKPGVARMQAAKWNSENAYSCGQQDNLSRNRGGKADAVRLAEGSSPGRAMVKRTGHHRSLRAGHAFTRAARELGRAACLLF